MSLMFSRSIPSWTLKPATQIPQQVRSLPFTLRQLVTSNSPKMSQEPQIIAKTDLPLDQAKWVTLKKIIWRDQEGKEVGVILS